MKQYQIITFIVICLTVFTVYQIQRGLIQKTHSFLVESFERIPETPSLLPASSDGTLPLRDKELTKPAATPEPAVSKEKITKVKNCAEVKISQKKKAQLKANSSETKMKAKVLVRESGPTSGSGCMGFILF